LTVTSVRSLAFINPIVLNKIDQNMRFWTISDFDTFLKLEFSFIAQYFDKNNNASYNIVRE